jgi:F0F1-type ATP synthase assembly protein I
MVVGSEIVGFTVTGLLLDYAIGTMPWCTVALTLLGLAASFMHLIRMVKVKPPGGGGS